MLSLFLSTLISIAPIDSVISGNTVQINQSNGGFISEFTDYTNLLIKRKSKVIINGPCYSACTLIATNQQLSVCVTPKAALYFHKGSRGPADHRIRFDLDYPEPWSTWISTHGGLPADGWLSIKGPELEQYIKKCTVL